MLLYQWCVTDVTITVFVLVLLSTCVHKCVQYYMYILRSVFAVFIYITVVYKDKPYCTSGNQTIVHYKSSIFDENVVSEFTLMISIFPRSREWNNYSNYCIIWNLWNKSKLLAASLISWIQARVEKQGRVHFSSSFKNIINLYLIDLSGSFIFTLFLHYTFVYCLRKELS